ncbi:AP2/ERF and B3 domain-containing transcription factor At1g51120-like [Hibiscus syriacus]|uniref:AP2/ERF and B3 domain-containing transcription factor At1g51120-like n=1 Tax=Hibiscus syriacus TaxID=106335 RepID=UPI001921EB20|nr:AP2/ERF and B3 domain-containing transcription factor At1g51120-like [Hibiscus syriacus]
MMDDDSSIILNTKWTVLPSETSVSGNSNYKHRPSKRARHDHGGSLPRFKGLAPQQNGNWGAQIYANHQRIWLGTFKSEKEAALAYDSAAIKLRCAGDTQRNFPWTDLNIQEPAFQSLYSNEDVLNMIRDGSYQAKLEDFVKILSKKDGKSTTNLNKKLVHGNTQFSCTQLFQKELTPSDVGKLNRLVIPKKYAVKHFPQICETGRQSLAGEVEDTELVFYDKLMATWKFRYCYWRSSQSFVFTRGWSRFVKEKKLSEKDTVTFYACERPGGDQNGRNFFLIDVNYNGEKDTLETSADDDCLEDNMELELELNLGKKSYCKISSEDKTVEKKSVTLFGVQIN